jgi:hypothetical protein
MIKDHLAIGLSPWDLSELSAQAQISTELSRKLWHFPSQSVVVRWYFSNLKQGRALSSDRTVASGLFGGIVPAARAVRYFVKL